MLRSNSKGNFNSQFTSPGDKNKTKEGRLRSSSRSTKQLLMSSNSRKLAKKYTSRYSQKMLETVDFGLITAKNVGRGGEIKVLNKKLKAKRKKKK
jgi:hypothetical protein